jgi:hypothetical protein
MSSFGAFVGLNYLSPFASMKKRNGAEIVSRKAKSLVVPFGLCTEFSKSAFAANTMAPKINSVVRRSGFTELNALRKGQSSVLFERCLNEWACDRRQ